MKKRGLASLILALLLLSVFIAGCPIDDPVDTALDKSGTDTDTDTDTNTDTDTELVQDTNPPFAYNGTGTATGSGFAQSQDYLNEGNLTPGAPITVTVTVDTKGKISDVKIDGPNETPDFGGALITKMIPEIKKYNTFDLVKQPDGTSSASHTFNGVKRAGNNALATIKTKWETAHPSISINEKALLLAKNAKATLTATVIPADSDITWISGDTDIATVDAESGEVTAVEKGMVIIIATITVEGKPVHASCQVVVTE